MKNKTKICFVCHGNICRSPMAEFVFKKLANESGVADCYEICSRATSSEEIYRGVGNPIYPPAQSEMNRRGVPFDKGKRAQQLNALDYDQFDLFVCMDDNNTRNCRYIFGGDKDNKIVKLLDYTTRGGSVADPWYTDRFDLAYNDIYDGCVALLEKLK